MDQLADFLKTVAAMPPRSPATLALIVANSNEQLDKAEKLVAKSRLKTIIFTDLNSLIADLESGSEARVCLLSIEQYNGFSFGDFSPLVYKTNKQSN